MLDTGLDRAHSIEIVQGALPVRTPVILIVVIFYLITAAVVAALDPGADPGSAIVSGLLWPFSVLGQVWEHMTSFFGPLFG